MKTLRKLLETVLNELYDQIEEFEPRAQVADITFEHDAATGRTIPIIYLEEVETDNE